MDTGIHNSSDSGSSTYINTCTIPSIRSICSLTQLTKTISEDWNTDVCSIYPSDDLVIPQSFTSLSLSFPNKVVQIVHTHPNTFTMIITATIRLRNPTTVLTNPKLPMWSSDHLSIPLAFILNTLRS